MTFGRKSGGIGFQTELFGGQSGGTGFQTVRRPVWRRAEKSIRI
jgi:hypothetical protein